VTPFLCPYNSIQFLSFFTLLFLSSEGIWIFQGLPVFYPPCLLYQGLPDNFFVYLPLGVPFVFLAIFVYSPSRKR
jgi:hypothetical protein